jgi:hypothetical protein
VRFYGRSSLSESTSPTPASTPTRRKWLSDILPGGDLDDFLSRMDEHTRRIIETHRREMIARDMLKDSPSHQIRLKHTALSFPYRFDRSDHDIEPYFRPYEPKPLNVAPFQRDRKNMVNVLSPTLSKSEAVFAAANDALDDMIESGRAPATPLLGICLSRLLSESHAFDSGDSAEVEWIKGERDGLLAEMDRWFPSMPEPLIEIDSVDSVHMQAADFAAAIAREIWHRSGSLPRLVGSFDYATYNGRRISDTDTSSIQGRLLKLPSSSPAARRASEALMRLRSESQDA